MGINYTCIDRSCKKIRGIIKPVKDYNGNFATANLTIGRNGSPINGASAADVTIQTSGASMRRAVDFSDLNNTQMILPTGQSGNVKSAHYKDQAELYHSGGYRRTMFDLDEIIADTNIKHLILKP